MNTDISNVFNISIEILKNQNKFDNIKLELDDIKNDFKELSSLINDYKRITKNDNIS